MRFSTTRPKRPTRLRSRVTNETLARRAVAEITAAQRAGSIVLVGGRTPADLIVRAGQAHLRMDQLASYWSHAAVVLDWPGEPAGALGAEVTLDQDAAAPQVPERNGVTAFRLARYLDDERYPNFAVATLSLAPATDGEGAGTLPRPADPHDRIRDAVDEPLRERLRYPFLEWLAAWRAFTTAPFRFPNPSLQNMPHPGAAFCEYVLEAARIDLTPGATAPNACPETIWATFVRWHRQMVATGVTIAVTYVARDPLCLTRKPLPSQLGFSKRPGTARATTRARSKARRGERRNRG